MTERWPTLHDLEPGRDHRGRVWEGERCKSPECRGKRITVSFSVTDETWNAVVRDGNIVCLSCFDEMAQDLGINYEARLPDGLVFVRKGDAFYYSKAMNKDTLEKLVQVLREELGDALNANMLATWIEQRFLGKPIVLPTSFDPRD